ncbi:NAD(P)/FAD-dependent oxidoreductase [Pseudomonas lini]
MSKHDVVIVGAGPAGSAAAIFCAQHGLRVALLEQSAVCRDRPGETLPPGIEPLLQQLGIAHEILQGSFIRHTGNWVQWGTERHFNAFGGEPDNPWRGFQIPRRLFDSLLLSQAQASGVSVVRPCRAKKVIRKDDSVIGVETDKGVFPCSYMIDASGGNGWLARQLALERLAFHRDCSRCMVMPGVHLLCVMRRPISLRIKMAGTGSRKSAPIRTPGLA